MHDDLEELMSVESTTKKKKGKFKLNKYNCLVETRKRKSSEVVRRNTVSGML